MDRAQVNVPGRIRRDSITSLSSRPSDRTSQYAGTFLIALATLALEVTLTRLLSVTTWYHLAFFAVSIAMLGMTAGAVTVYLKPRWFVPESLRASASKACLIFALVVPATLLILCSTPVVSTMSARGLRSLFVVSIASLAPFYFAGVAISGVITRTSLPIGSIYASDLAGASLGCLVVLGGLEILDAPSLILVSALTGALAAAAFGLGTWTRRLKASSVVVLCLIAALTATNALTPMKIRPLIEKGERPGTLRPIFEKWNSFSRVVLYEKRGMAPQYWGASPLAPQSTMIEQHRMEIDGEAATTVRRFASVADIEHLAFDVTNVGYYLRPAGAACIIGVGGGRDIQSAILFGHRSITALEVNPIFTDLLKGRLRDFAGVADYRGVRLITDEARSYLSRTPEKYSIIQMSLTDTWAATGAGAFSLSENVLYTVEAWRIFLDRLASGGILTVSRWFSASDLGETGRIVSLATATLLEAGVRRPADHIAMAACGNVSTLLLSREPFRAADLALLREVCSRLEFTLVMCPGTPPDDADLRSLLSAGSYSDLERVAAGKRLDYRPARDENPYFFNTVRLKDVFVDLFGRPGSTLDTSGVVAGNIAAASTLILLIVCLLVLSVLAVVLPLLVGAARSAARGVAPAETAQTEGGLLWSGAAYFSLIGLGFMFVEIALVARLSVFLGHPIYALGVLLFSIIASAGLGSYLSGGFPLTKRPWVYIYPVAIAAAIIAVRFIAPFVGHRMVASSMPAKIAASVLTVVPLGLLLGVAFPTGMRLVAMVSPRETPWYWALNGIFGVLGSALTVLVSIDFGISTSLYAGALCYLLIPASIRAIIARAAPRICAQPPLGLESELER